MKYNYSTSAIFFLGRAESPARKKLYLGVTAVLSVAAVWFYGMHFYRMLHPRLPVVASQVAPAATAVPMTPALQQPVVKKIPVPSPVETLAPTPATVPTVAPVAVPVAAPVILKTTEPVGLSKLFIAGNKVRSSPVQSAVEKSMVQKPVAQTKADKLARAAQLAFGNMMDMANHYPDIYGFKPGDLLQDARLGDAIPIYTIAQQDCAGYKTGQPVKSLLKSVDRWAFPVFIGDQIRCVVQVSRDGNNYVPGSGSKILAVFWSKILEKWPPTKGYHPQLIFNPNMPDYYFTVPELETQNITDTSDVLSYGANLSPAAVILASWR